MGAALERQDLPAALRTHSEALDVVSLNPILKASFLDQALENFMMRGRRNECYAHA